MNIFNKVWGPTGSGPPPTDDLTPPTRDALFRFQMTQEKPFALTPESLFVAKICGKYSARETHHYAKSVFGAAQKAHVITEGGLPDTEKIDKSLVNKIAIISVPKQRELVNLLFFWEEEITRLRLLDQEEAEVKEMVKEHERIGRGEGASDGQDLKTALKAVQLKRAMLPSQRTSDGAAKGEDVLPAYD